MYKLGATSNYLFLFLKYFLFDLLAKNPNVSVSKSHSVIVFVTGDVPLEAGLDDGVNVGGVGGGGAGLDLGPHARF